MAKVRIDFQESIARLVLTRPEVRNAFDPEVIVALIDAAESIAKNPQIRVVILSGEGPQFCAGADLNSMRASLDVTEAENLADAQRLGRMFEALDRLPQMLIGRIHGAALGGGAGLAAICDVVVASRDTVFGFSEVRLGLIPAVIAPYVLSKIGYGQARLRFLNGTRFDAATALQIGLVHEVVPVEALDATIERHIKEALACAPGAIAATKALLAELITTPIGTSNDYLRHERLKYTAAALAQRRRTPEAQSGMQAFLARERAPWLRP